MLLGEDRSDGKKLRYFYDSEGMCGFRYYNGSTWTEYVYVKNAKGDVLAILNGSGTVVANYSYDAWGNWTVSGGDVGTYNSFRYRGYYYDTAIMLYYLNTRWYDPETGRFISPDSVDYLDPESINGLNLYAYCLNNPVMYTDPTGHFILTLLAVAGLIASATLSGFLAGANAVAGESFGSAFLGGFVNGLISGIGLALGLAVSAAEGIPAFIAGGFIAAGFGIAGGFAGSIITQSISYGNVDWGVALTAGVVSAGTNLMSFIGLNVSEMFSAVPKIFNRFMENLKLDIVPVGISVYLGTLPIFNPNDLRGKI